MSGCLQQALLGQGQFGNDSFTKILLHMDGADAATMFIDSNAGGAAHTWTANGNAQLDTAVTKFGPSSGLFDGTGDYVTTPDSTDFTLGAGDWTCDCWFNWNGGSGVRGFVCGQADAAGTNASISFSMEHTVGNNMRLNIGRGAAVVIVTGTTNITTTGWHHIAGVASGGNAKLFLDGVQEGGDVAIGGTPNNSAKAFSVGRVGEFASQTWNGWIDEFRLSVGVARWTANFTPPTAPYGNPATS